MSSHRAKRHLPAAVEEVSFDDFSGDDFEAMNRFHERLFGRKAIRTVGAGRFGLVVLQQLAEHWWGLIQRDSANVRFAIQAAYWVFIVSGENCGPGLAALNHPWSLLENGRGVYPRDEQRSSALVEPVSPSV